MVLQNLQANTLVVGVDEILDQIRIIKELQNSQLVGNEVSIKLQTLTLYDVSVRY